MSELSVGMSAVLQTVCQSDERNGSDTVGTKMADWGSGGGKTGRTVVFFMQ